MELTRKLFFIVFVKLSYSFISTYLILSLTFALHFSKEFMSQAQSACSIRFILLFLMHLEEKPFE